MSLNCSFIGSRFSGLIRPTTIFESRGDIDASNNLLDHTENLLTYGCEFQNWTEVGTCAVTTNQYRNPLDGVMDADYLDSTGDTNGRRVLSASNIGAVDGRKFTISVWVRADTQHTCTIRSYDSVSFFIDTDITVTTQWRRFYATGIAAGVATGISFSVYPGEANVAAGTAYFYGAQMVENTDGVIPGMGPFIKTVGATNKPRHDLAQTNGPTQGLCHLQGADGNKMAARKYVAASTQYYSKAHHASMNIFDGDHTITILHMQDLGAGNQKIFVHSSVNDDGMYVYLNDSYIVNYSKSGASIGASESTVSTSDGRYHILQAVRDSNIVTMYADGVAGTPVDVTGYGIDGSRTLYLGVYNAASSYFDGQISYVRVDAEALSVDRLAYEREVLLGLEYNSPASML